MTESIKFSKIGKQDLALGTGQFQTQLADGRVVTMDQINVPDLYNSITPLGIFNDIVTKGPWVDIRAHGAVGDGTTDDTVAIQAAINSLPSTGGKIILTPGFNFKINAPYPSGLSLSNKNNIIFDGMGSQITLTKNTRLLTVDTVSNLLIENIVINGTLQTDGYTGNEEQGRIDLTSCTNCKIRNNKWNNVTALVFIRTLNDQIWVTNNQGLNNHTGIQTGGGNGVTNTDLFITDNYLLGNITTPEATASDDQIATFSGTSGRIIISRNTIDKQGSTSKNQAHAILISMASGSTKNSNEIIVSDNIIRNVVTTTGTQARAAISVTGTTTETVNNINIHHNQIYNTNLGIEVSAGVNRGKIENNIIDTTVDVASQPAGQDSYGILVHDSPSKNGLSVSNNMIYSSAKSAILINNSSNTKVDDNIIISSVGNAIDADGLTGASVSSNQIYSTTGIGIKANALINSLISNNIVLNSSTYNYQIQGTTTNLKVIGNSSGGAGSGNWNDTSGSATIIWQANEGHSDSTYNQIISTLATGTAPLSVASTTKVANLVVEGVGTQATSGTPAGTPVAGGMIFDTANFKLWAYSGTTWKFIQLA